MDVKREVKVIIPNLCFDSHKGEAGRIGFVGGTKVYTGAPYFAAISCLRVGADLAHVFCYKDAAPVIKSYSPELMVHPILDSTDFIAQISETLPVLHSLVIGPGLGRDPKILQSVRDLIYLAEDKKLPLVLDADALFLLNDTPHVVQSYKQVVLTPNQIEFIRLFESMFNVALNPKQKIEEEQVKELARSLDVTILLKGKMDIISDGVEVIVTNEEGSPRRCGGQGDLLAGSLGVFNYWAHSQHEKKFDKRFSATMLAAAGASLLARKCSYLAFQKLQRSALVTDMIAEIQQAFTALFR